MDDKKLNKRQQLIKSMRLSYSRQFELLDNFISRKGGSEDRQELTTKAYRSDIELFYMFLRTIDKLTEFPNIDSKFIDRWMETLKVDSTKARRSASLKSFYKYLLNEDIVQKDITKVLPTIKVKLKKFDILTDPEIIDLLSVCDNQKDSKGLIDKQAAQEWRLMILMLATSGLRISEFLNIEVKNLNLKERNGIVGRKGGDDGPFMYSEYTRDLLSKYIEERGMTEGKLFDYKYHTFLKHLKKLGRAAGISEVKLHPHTFRHTWTTEGSRIGMDREIQRKYGGWTSSKMLDRYDHLNTEQEAEKTKGLGKSWK